MHRWGYRWWGRTELRKLTDYNALLRYLFIPFRLSTVPLMPTRSVPSPFTFEGACTGTYVGCVQYLGHGRGLRSDFGSVSMNGRSVRRKSVRTQDPFRSRADSRVIKGQLLVGRRVRTHLSGFRVVWMSGKWIGRGLGTSVDDFSGVVRGYQGQDARYWLVRTTLVGRSAWWRARK